MTSKFEAPAYKALSIEQEAVQAGKFQKRTLEEYSDYIFPAQNWHIPQSSAVTDFLRPVCVNERVSLDGVIQGLCDAKSTLPAHWVDMGGGQGLSMRQLATDPKRRAELNMTNVDLFDLHIDTLTPNEKLYLENVKPGMTGHEAAPRLVQADVETVILPEPADLITSVEVMQYLNNPLAAISNWYDQLTDNGLMIISTEHDWMSWIRYRQESDQGDWDETPAKHSLEALQAGNVAFAATAEVDWKNGYRPTLNPDRIRTMVIQKRPGTRLAVNSSVTGVWLNPDNYKAVYYNRPAPGSSSILEVIQA